jgi:hypothetical protein
MDGYRKMLFSLTSEGKITAATLLQLQNKVARYEQECGRHRTLMSQVGGELFLTWLCADQGQAQSLPNSVFAIGHLLDGVDRSWLASKDFKMFVKRLTKLYGSKPDTAIAWTLAVVHAALEIAGGKGTGESSRNRVIILLLFLAAYRIGEVARDLRGLKATNVLLGPECLILTKEDSKTKSQSTTSFVVNSTNSGLQPAAAVHALLSEMGVGTKTVKVSLRGKLVSMEQPDYFTADLWFHNWKAGGSVEHLQMSMLQRLSGVLDHEHKPMLQLLKKDLMKTAKVRSAVTRNDQDQFMIVWGGSEVEVLQFISWAEDHWGLRLVINGGPLIRGTRTVRNVAGGVWGYGPLSTGQAGKVTSALVRAAVAHSYSTEGGMSADHAQARVAREKWVAHGGRRGFTTEVSALLAKFRSECPGMVAEDSEHLVNIHADWVSDEATTQEHYTGMRPLEQLLLLTQLC